MNHENVIKGSRIACATLLLRCYRCAVDPNGENCDLERYGDMTDDQLIKRKIIIPRPGVYKNGIYANHWTFTDKDQITLYKAKSRRPNPDLKTITKFVFNKQGIIMN